MNSPENTHKTNPTTENPVLNAADLGRLIRKKRKNLKITQKILAGMCNVGVRFISDLENGKSTLEFDKVLKVISILGFKITVKG